MTAKRAILWATLTIASLVLLGPVLAFEALYHFELSEIPTPELPSSDVPELARQALWLAAGQKPQEEVEPLWVGNFFDMSAPLSRRGRGAAGNAAWYWMDGHGARLKQGLHYHLRGAAAAVWFTRHATAAQLRSALAEWTSFGRDAYGFRAAAQAYFGVPPESLSVAQTALLVALVGARAEEATCYPERARERRARVLSKLVEAGLITQAQREQADAEPLGVLDSPTVCPARKQ